MGKNNFRHRERPLSWHPPFIEPQPKILILCEGIVSERDYFEGFKDYEHNSLVTVEIDKEGGAPKTSVERAKSRKKEAEAAAEKVGDDTIKYDEVWCVYDTDIHPNLPDALQQARDNGIHLAISNPCFELWILLHYRDQTAHIERKPATSEVKKFIPRYDKHVEFQDLQPGYTNAVSRAKSLEKYNKEIGFEGRNPSTDVHKLTERIREFGREERLKRLLFEIHLAYCLYQISITMFMPLADERLAEIYKQIVSASGLITAELLTRLRNKPYAERVFAVTSIGQLSLTTASSYLETKSSYSFQVQEKIDAGKPVITMFYRPNGSRKAIAEHQCPLEEAVEYIDLYVMRILLERYGKL